MQKYKISWFLFILTQKRLYANRKNLILTMKLYFLPVFGSISTQIKGVYYFGLQRTFRNFTQRFKF